jgi:hypothetical protein
LWADASQSAQSGTTLVVMLIYDRLPVPIDPCLVARVSIQVIVIVVGDIVIII